MVKVRQEKEKLLTLEIEKLTAQHGADSAEALAAQRLEVTNRVKLEQELVKMKILNERKEGLAKRQNLAAKTRGERAKSSLAENLIKPKTDEATAKSQLAQNLVKPKTDEATAKSQLAQNLVKPKTDEATAKASEAGSKSRLVESLVQPKIDEQTAKTQLAQNLVKPKTEEAKEKVKSAKALTRSRDRSNTKTSSGGKPTGVSLDQFKKYQTAFDERRDAKAGDEYMNIPQVVREKIRSKSSDSFRKAFSGRKGDTGKDFMGSLLSATPELQFEAVAIEPDGLGNDFAIPGSTYRELKALSEEQLRDPRTRNLLIKDGYTAGKKDKNGKFVKGEVEHIIEHMINE